MCPVISKDLRKYYKLNKEFSARIIVYRFVLNFYTLCPPSCPDQMIILVSQHLNTSYSSVFTQIG